jgi:putative transposase
MSLLAYHHTVRIDFSRPGKPTDNAFIETFNGFLRDECLNVHWFEILAELRRLIEAWRTVPRRSVPDKTLRETAVRTRPKKYSLSKQSSGMRIATAT